MSEDDTKALDVWLRERADAALERTAERAAEKAVSQTFMLLGVNLDDRSQVQEFRDTWAWARDDRRAKIERSRAIKRSAIQAVFTALATCVVAFGTWIYHLRGYQ